MYISQEREFFFPVDIVEQAGKLGIDHARLKDMLRHSTRITHPFGNRRYENYLFLVEGNRVLAFGTVSETEAGHEVQMLARRCQYCDEGLVPASIPCPQCEGRGLPTGCNVCNGKGRIRTFNECERCDGKGNLVQLGEMSKE